MHKKTGEQSDDLGRYKFAGYVDGTTNPEPTGEECIIDIAFDEDFPPMHDREAYWEKVSTASNNQALRRRTGGGG